MNKKRVVLVQPPIQDFYLTKKRTIPYGLASIAASVRQHGYEVDIVDGLATSKSKLIPKPEIFDYLDPFYRAGDISLFGLFHNFFHFGYSHQHVAAQVKHKTPFLVGISSLFTAYADQAASVASEIKRLYPRCLVVAGGHHPTAFPEKVLENPAIDFVIRGEGELSMPLLCNALTQKTDLESVPGLCFKNAAGYHISEPAWIDDLGALPVPAFDLINQDFYSRKKRGAGITVSSRGCPMPCTYCAVSSTSCHAKYRLRPVENVLEEILTQLDSNDIGFLDFEDENLCLNKKWFTSLFNSLLPLLKNRNIELRAMNGLYPGSLDEDNIILLKKCGFQTLNLSLGSTSKSQLERFKRPDIRTQFAKVLKLAQKHDLETVSYLIAGAPGQDARSSLNDLLSLAVHRTLIGLSIYYPAPGSMDYGYCENRGLLPDDIRLFRSSALPLEDQTTRLQSVTLLRISRIINFLKYLLDTHGHLNFKTLTQTSGLSEREGLSIRLLLQTLKTGDIQGAGKDDIIFKHAVDNALTLEFIEKIKQARLSGIKTALSAVIEI